MRILGVGYCTLDYLGVVERFAEPDFKVDLDQFSVQGGGSAATALVALARWGIDSGFVGKVGQDARGERIIETLAGEGIDTTFMVRQPEAVSQASFITIESSTGRKMTYQTRGSVEPLQSEEIDRGCLDGVELLHLDGMALDAQLPLAREARERGIRITLDATSSRESVNELVELSDCIICSEKFASAYTGVGSLEAMCEKLLESGPSVAVVTLGREGSAAMSLEERSLARADAYPVQVFDTTGAGDVYHGAFLYSMIQGWSLTRSVRFSNVAAGLTCTSVGGRSRIEDVATIEACMLEHYGES